MTQNDKSIGYNRVSMYLFIFVFVLWIGYIIFGLIQDLLGYYCGYFGCVGNNFIQTIYLGPLAIVLGIIAIMGINIDDGKNGRMLSKTGKKFPK